MAAEVAHGSCTDHLNGLRKYPHRHLVLLIDFDGQGDARRDYFLEHFPKDVRDRVFLLDTRSEPEPLRKRCGDSLEAIGKHLTTECYRDETGFWVHELLAHNAPQRQRLNAKVKSILF